MENVKTAIIERLKKANNVLVTVSKNPSLDQLSAAIGLALYLNKLNKHASAVFSGQIPSAIEFLEPERTLEKNTDSLRDFIIALDKSKADKLRYKIEGDFVRIYITPYRTSIHQDDLNFSQGEINVDAIVALGVTEQNDLDEAVTSHGSVLHDADIISISNGQSEGFGSLNFVDEKASSLCEIVGVIVNAIDENRFDEQIATALLTGIVAETERFGNQKTVATTMAVSAKLLSAGANQQLVAENLAPKPEPVAEPVSLPVEPAPDLEQVDIPQTQSVDELLGVDQMQPHEGSVHEGGIIPPPQPRPLIQSDGMSVTPEAPDEEDLSLPPVSPIPAPQQEEEQPSQGDVVEPEQSVQQAPPEPPADVMPSKPNDGSLYIPHDIDIQEESTDPDGQRVNQIHIDEQGRIVSLEDDQPEQKLAEQVASPELAVVQQGQQPIEQLAVEQVKQPEVSPAEDSVVEQMPEAPDSPFIAQGQPSSPPPVPGVSNGASELSAPSHSIMTQPPSITGTDLGPAGASDPDIDEDGFVEPLTQTDARQEPILRHDSSVSHTIAVPEDKPAFNPMDFIPTDDPKFPSSSGSNLPPDQASEEIDGDVEYQPTQPGESLLDLEAAVADQGEGTVSQYGASTQNGATHQPLVSPGSEDDGPVIGFGSPQPGAGLTGQGPAFDEPSLSLQQQPVQPPDAPPGFPPPIMPSQDFNIGEQGSQPQRPFL